MADCKVFYSWQSDLPNSTNRSFIETALQKATKSIRNDDSIEVDPVVDRDTYGVPGSPDIASTIFKKIEEAQVFVCDISIINSESESGRPTPNPNVLIELGYAFKTLGSERVIMIMNTAFGKPENLPFDLKMRRVITYSMNKEENDKSQERNELQSSLRKALNTILNQGNLSGNFNSQFQVITNKLSYNWELEKSTIRIEKAKYYLSQSIEELKSIIVQTSELSTEDREYLTSYLKDMQSLTEHKVYWDNGGKSPSFWEKGDGIITKLREFTNTNSN
jgi:hypothetical protein